METVGEREGNGKSVRVELQRKAGRARVRSTPCYDQHGENDDEGGEGINVVAVQVVWEQPRGKSNLSYFG